MTHAAHDGAGVPDTVSTVSPDLARIYDPVRGDLDAVAHLLRDELSADHRVAVEVLRERQREQSRNRDRDQGEQKGLFTPHPPLRGTLSRRAGEGPDW